MFQACCLDHWWLWCFRQAVLIAVLVKLDVIQAIDTWVFNNVKDVANGLQVLISALDDKDIT